MTYLISEAIEAKIANGETTQALKLLLERIETLEELVAILQSQVNFLNWEHMKWTKTTNKA